ncbi:hypothetical protein NBNDMPCG_00160 [Klebsiella phage vB_KqM-Westerburg]|nr:hypothetical protein NBNDMPCG_00160 [Klebsiella phage vB_KqM-Westerburg]
MADYLSKYTGQQIDSILDAVDGKLNKTDVVNDITVDDDLSPASAHLTFVLKSAIDTMNDVLSNKVVRTDGQEQTINGKKTFASVLNANGGIFVPAQRSITITDEPLNSTDAVNLSMLKKHGLSTVDSVGSGSGLKISLLSNGYNKLEVDLSNLVVRTDSTSPQSLAVYSPTGGSQIWSMTSLFNSIFADTRFNDYVKVVDYDSDMLNIETQFTSVNNRINLKLDTATYTTKMTSLDSQIANLQSGKVDNTTYTAKMTSLDSQISGLSTNKVDKSTYDTKMASLDGQISDLATNKVDVLTYTTDMNALNLALAGSVKLAKTNTTSVSVPASGSAALPDFTLVNLCQILITAKWGTLVDTFLVTMTYDGTLQATSLTQKSTAGTLSFAGSVVSGKLRLTMTNANTTTAASVDYSLRASF